MDYLGTLVENGNQWSALMKALFLTLKLDPSYYNASQSELPQSVGKHCKIHFLLKLY